jgi:SagB-type dehydrogenase family enzyme
MHAEPEIILLLDRFDTPSSPKRVAQEAVGYRRVSVLSAIDRLARLGLLLPREAAARRRSRLRAWKDNLASAHYHLACRDVAFLSAGAADAFLRERLRGHRRPLPFKSYPGRRLRLAAPSDGSEGFVALQRLLRARRTTREFDPRAAPLADLSAILNETWGQSGWLEAGPLGRLPTRTSPSAGALQPIECYVFAFRVDGLPPGLYHYDSRRKALRLLRKGDLRQQAIRAAAGQQFVGRAAFLCAMTAVFERTLWKYELENAYRVVWMDAGHLGQTFSLLAVARGLAPFTTAAIHDTTLEQLLRIDGVREFPVYLCGAGMAKRGGRS